uniref:Uncharacterized protein n=1 Tax=Oryzias latipes TaxID=8090 RepID=A0A3P9MKE5_ORYLA
GELSVPHTPHDPGHENIQYHGILLPAVAHTKESLEYAENFSVKDSDVFVVTYPKSGEFVLFVL